MTSRTRALTEPRQNPRRTRIAKLLRRILASALGTLVALTLLELGLRLANKESSTPFAHNPVIRKQADHVALFELDEEIGHRLTEGRFVGVYQEGLLTAKEIASDPRRKGRLLVLNLGDSSTSGWDSDVVVENARRHADGQDLLSPLQTYKTYSSLLAESEAYYVVNAGVPGFTSAQGALYLTRLFKRFATLGIQVDAVTVYFGNNDSAWNGNILDSDLISNSGLRLRIARLVDQLSNYFRIVPRVPSDDYATYLRQIINQCRDAGAHVVLIEPVVPYRWPPGLRAKGLSPVQATEGAAIGSYKIGESLANASDYYREGESRLTANDNDGARELFSMAREADYAVPRIKEGHRGALRRIAEDENIALVAVSAQIPLDDTNYFLDYCHPIEPANHLIAAGVLKALDGVNWNKRRR